MRALWRAYHSVLSMSCLAIRGSYSPGIPIFTHIYVEPDTSLSEALGVPGSTLVSWLWLCAPTTPPVYPDYEHKQEEQRAVRHREG
jgi:hypothetical protein